MGLSIHPTIFHKTGIKDGEKARDALIHHAGSHVLARVRVASHAYLGGKLRYESRRLETYGMTDSDGNTQRFRVDNLIHMIVVSSQLL